MRRHPMSDNTEKMLDISKLRREIRKSYKSDCIDITNEMKAEDVVCFLILENELRDCIKKNCFIFLDGSIVRFSTECLEMVEGKLGLTSDFLKEPHNKCITAKVIFPRDFCNKFVYAFTFENNDMVTISSDDWHDMFRHNGGPNPPSDFGDYLVYLMKKKHIKNDILAEASHLSTKTITRLRNYHGEGTCPKLQTVVAVCIGLKLHVTAALTLVMLAGYWLRITQQDQVYMMILSLAMSISIEDANTILYEFGLPLLSDEEEICEK